MKTKKNSKSILKFTAALGVLTAALYLLSYYEAQNLPDMTLHPDNADIVQRGKVLYGQHCAGCHGDNLEGQKDWQDKKPFERRRAPPLDATGRAWEHADKTLFMMTKFGVHALEGKGTLNSNMPAFVGILEDEEIVAVLSYVESTWAQSDTEKPEVSSEPE
ncbi:c-type cytochrome [Kordiimonas lacus]|uniref:Cytochrome C oxidase, cbb3-type, subunit III n=1 Tax=Kordiimonas lacus TaxID=637679 RepID=A0A1G6WII2_9PROT|nr:cytochrome c [Kordiimonas lacus]SDD65692.1 Cytochrome C oxidase, cbb3-type, subunit III [Kordiimonas lacus]